MISEANGERFVKILRRDGLSTFQSSQWFLPKGNRKAKKMRKITSGIYPCQNGYHVTTIDGAMRAWMQNLEEVLWYVEVGDNPMYEDYKYVSNEARILSRVPDEDLPKHYLYLRDAVPALFDEIMSAWKEAGITEAIYNNRDFKRDTRAYLPVGGYSRAISQYYAINGYGGLYDAVSNSVDSIVHNADQEYSYGERDRIGGVVQFVTSRRAIAIMDGFESDLSVGDPLQTLVDEIKRGVAYTMYDPFSREFV